MEQDDISLTINVTANPPIDMFSWYKDNEPLESSGRYELTNNTISITDLSYMDYITVYKLNVTNPVGSSNFSFTLDVQCKS